MARFPGPGYAMHTCLALTTVELASEPEPWCFGICLAL